MDANLATSGRTSTPEDQLSVPAPQLARRRALPVPVYFLGSLTARSHCCCFFSSKR